MSGDNQDTVFEDSFSREVWKTTYKDHNDETVDDTMRRVAKYIASAEKLQRDRDTWEERFYQMLSGFKGTVGGRTYSNAGVDLDGCTLHNCVSGETLVMTDEGVFEAKTLKDKTVNVLSEGNVYRKATWYSYGKQDLYRVTLRNGDFFDVTKDHEWIVTKSKGGYERIKTFELAGRNVPFNGRVEFDYDEDDYLEGIKHGLTFGDGTLYKDHKNDVYSILNQFGDSRHLIVDYFEWFRTSRYKEDSMGVYSVSGLPKKYKTIPDIEKTSLSYIRGFIAGHIAADGNVDSRGSVSLHSANYENLIVVRKLAAAVGIPSISLRLERDTNPFNGKFSQLWKLTFIKKYFFNDEKLLLKNLHKERMYNSSDLLIKQTIKVVSVENLKRTEEVYCCVEPETHTMTIGYGILTGQCFVSPRDKYDIDSIQGIFKDLLNQTLTLKSEGGWGQNFSWIRPRGSFIHGIGVESPGAVKYMEIYDKTSDVITAGSGKKSSNKKAKGKIRKGAMMSVLDCISGNALIDTIEGKVPLKDLVGKRPYLYCTDGNGNVYVRQANKIWSKGIKKTIRIGLDNGDYIECTPEHEFLLSSGEYRKAKDLKMKDSLAALNKRLHGNYLFLGVAGSRKQVAEHNAIYEMKYGSYPTALTKEKRRGDMTIAHHVDHDTINNHPDNIMNMSISEHSIHHGDVFEEHRDRIAKERKGKNWEEYYGEERAKEIKKKYTKKRKGQPPWNKGKTGKEYKEHYKKGFSNQFVENKNHKVLYIQDSIEQEVFDISMPAPYHNFSVNDIFVHNCWHPDVIEFITAKQSPGRLTKFNMSVNCTDEFMDKVISIKEKVPWFHGQYNEEQKKELNERLEAIEEIDKWDLRYPDTTHEKYKEEWDGDLKAWEEKEYPVTVFKTVSATWLWNLIMESTYNRAEPGILFLDRANYYNPGYYFEKVVATNPCGEQQLSPGNICCLGSMNLTQFVRGKSFDYEKLRRFVGYMVRFLDNVNSLSLAPLPEYEEAMRLKRRIGIGILGWGSALYMLKIRFGSEEAGRLRDRVMKTIAQQAYMSSIDLAEEKGMFDFCDPDKHAEGVFISKLGLSDEYMDKLRVVGIRNSSLLSIQPTGNTSVFANVVSGGLEPVFMPEYIRTAIVNHMPDEIEDVCPKWYEGEWHETDLFKFTKEGDEEILRGVYDGTVYKIDKNRGLTKEIECKDYGVRWLQSREEWDPKADYVVDTKTLTVEDHVNDVNGFARWVDSAMSKTINVPYECPFDEFQNIYLDAYKKGYVKGITTYRDGTMATVLSAKEEKEATDADEEIIMDDVNVPSQAPAMVSTIKAEGRKWYLTTILNEQQSRPIAFFVHTNHHEKSVTTEDAIDHLIGLAKRKGIPARWIYETIEKMEKDNNSTKIARAISLNLRHGVLIKNVVFALEQVDNVFVGSFLFQIRKFLMSYIKDGEKVQNGDCPECGAKDSFVFSEGCTKCANCGFSKCG